ncbi:MAG: SMI1/KNR4 family protein [Thermoanaerobaculia bacterium]|jgi:hypothetical protein
MTRDELLRLEGVLEVALPPEYVQLVLELPVARERGTTDGPLWDVAEKLIAHNLHLRRECDWPAHMFCIGEDGGGNQFAIDVRETDPCVFEVEFEDFGTHFPVSYPDLPAPLNLARWFAVYIEDLERDGIDISAPAVPQMPLTKLEMIAGRVLIGIFVIGILLLPVSGLLALVRRLTGWSMAYVPALAKTGIVMFAASGGLMMWLGRDRSRNPAA